MVSVYMQIIFNELHTTFIKLCPNYQDISTLYFLLDLDEYSQVNASSV